MAVVEGMEDEGDDKLWTKCGKFYIDDGVKAVVFSGGIHTTQ